MNKKRRRYGDTKETKHQEEIQTEDIYDDKQREKMLNEDEITASESDFMLGREMTSKKIRRLKRSGHKDTVSVELAEDDYRED
jgi:hypothetical protein